MRCGSCGGGNAYQFYWAGVMSIRCDDCGADLMPGVDLTGDEPVEKFEQLPGCIGCAHYLGGGMCDAGLEDECAAGGYEAKEGNQ